jgi:glycosyltransferase involved in cell wall biosynthesis
VTDLPGQADIVTLNACGIVVPPNDPAEIALAVARLAEQPDLARSMGERARSGAVERYSWDAAAAATHAILVDLLDD